MILEYLYEWRIYASDPSNWVDNRTLFYGSDDFYGWCAIFGGSRYATELQEVLQTIQDTDPDWAEGWVFYTPMNEDNRIPRQLELLDKIIRIVESQHLILRYSDRNAIDWIGHRYPHGDDLYKLLIDNYDGDHDWDYEGEIAYKPDRDKLREIVESDNLTCFAPSLVSKIRDYLQGE